MVSQRQPSGPSLTAANRETISDIVLILSPSLFGPVTLTHAAATGAAAAAVGGKTTAGSNQLCLAELKQKTQCDIKIFTSFILEGSHSSLLRSPLVFTTLTLQQLLI